MFCLYISLEIACKILFLINSFVPYFKNESKWQSKRMLGPFDPSESGTPFHWFWPQLRRRNNIWSWSKPNAICVPERESTTRLQTPFKETLLDKKAIQWWCYHHRSQFEWNIINGTLSGRGRQYPLTHFCTISLGLQGLNIFTFINNEALKVQANIRVNPNPNP